MQDDQKSLGLMPELARKSRQRAELASIDSLKEPGI
jgi:hypothetical protein